MSPKNGENKQILEFGGPLCPASPEPGYSRYSIAFSKNSGLCFGLNLFKKSDNSLKYTHGGSPFIRPLMFYLQSHGRLDT